MQKTTKVRITTTRKRTIKLSTLARQSFCGDCQQKVEVLTVRQALELLGTSKSQLDELILVGRVHAVSAFDGSQWICAGSLLA